MNLVQIFGYWYHSFFLQNSFVKRSAIFMQNALFRTFMNMFSLGPSKSTSKHIYIYMILHKDGETNTLHK